MKRWMKGILEWKTAVALSYTACMAIYMAIAALLGEATMELRTVFGMLVMCMAVFMRWFPLENPGAWLLFIGLFVAVFAVMTLGFEVYFRIVGRRYDGLLGQYRLQRERER